MLDPLQDATTTPAAIAIPSPHHALLPTSPTPYLLQFPAVLTVLFYHVIISPRLGM